MRRILPLLLFALLLLGVSSQTVVAQEAIDLPDYAPGDFWTYKVVFPDLDELLADLDPNATVTYDAQLTTTIEGSEEMDVGGTTTAVYNASQHVEFTLAGGVNISMDFFNDSLELNFTFDASVTVDGSVYLTESGLEMVAANLEFEMEADITTLQQGIELVIPADANGTVRAEFEYTSDTWDFPLEVGNQGQEASQVTGTAFVRATALGNTTDNSTSLEGNTTFLHEVTGAETVEVDAGTFDTLVINTTVEEDAEDVGYMLTYWAADAGGPVKREFFAAGQLVVALNLVDYQYRAAQRLTILGLDAIYWIPIGVGVAVVVAILVRLTLFRR